MDISDKQRALLKDLLLIEPKRDDNRGGLRQIIVGAMAIERNMFDGHTLSPQLEQVKEFTHGKIRKAMVDRGYRGRQKIGLTEVVMPNATRKESYYMKKQRES